MPDTVHKLAVVTGASTGIGLELARECAKHKFDLLVAANEPEIESAADTCRNFATISSGLYRPSSTLRFTKRLIGNGD
jgi:short-subunit dehydrogenase